MADDLILPRDSARDLLAANVSELMRTHPDKASPAKLAKRCFWPATAGPKRRGKRLSERYVRYVVNPVAEANHSPSLDVIEAIAKAFDLEAWQLLVNEKHLRLWMMGKLFSNAEAVTNAKVEQHYPLPPREEADGDAKRKGKPRDAPPPPDEDHE